MRTLLGAGRLQGLTVLLVDDEPALRQGVAAMLDLAGCRTLLAATGREALALCDREAEELAAVLLDLQLPGEDTAALCATLRAHRPALPIILTSGLPEAAARAQLGCPAGVGFLPKPFRMEQLRQTIEGVLEPIPSPSNRPASPPERPEGREAPGPSGVGEDPPPAAEPFASWLPRRVAEAVQRGEVPAGVLSRLRALLQAGAEASAALPRRAAVGEIAELAGIAPAQAAAVFEALERLPGVAPERLARRIAEAWLERERQQYQAGEGGGGEG
jgi:CheY-like chemotaxis protein